MSETWPPFLGDDLPDHPASDPEVAIIPVPYDGTSTWAKGADAGPRALLEASTQLELFDVETRTEPWRRGIVTRPPLRHEGPPDALAPLVRAAVDREAEAGRLPVVLGGEHSVSIGAFDAVAARHDDLVILQIDAHADTRETWEGSSHNHACVMARARERAPIVQVGIRSLDAGEMSRLDPSRVVFAHEIAGRRPDRGWMDRVTDRLASKTWITFDLDAFDPAVLPATGTPEPGGIDWYEATGLVDRVAAASEIVGFDVVELCPRPGLHASDFTAAKLVHRMIASILRARPPRDARSPAP